MQKLLIIILHIISFSCFAQHEQKSDSIPIISVKDDFVDVVDADEPLPTWASRKFDQLRSKYHRLYQVQPTYLSTDFNGDTITDVAVFVNHISDDKRGIIYLFQNTDYIIVGGGVELETVGDDLKWAHQWEIFNKGKTYQSTFAENGDIIGEKEVKLKHQAISLRADEVPEDLFILMVINLFGFIKVIKSLLISNS